MQCNKHICDKKKKHRQIILAVGCSDLMWLRLGPVLQSGEDTVIALDDPVLLDGVRLELSGGDGHAESDLQNPTAYQTEQNKTI